MSTSKLETGSVLVTPTTTPINLLKKLLKISEEMGRLPKNGYNDFHKYDYVTEADALDRFRELCIENNVFVSPNNLDTTLIDGITTVDVEYTVTDLDTGEEITRRFPGQGQDKGDKGVYKALTGSYKYFILKGFMVPTGDDPERDTGVRSTKSSSTSKSTKTSGTGKTSSFTTNADARFTASPNNGKGNGKATSESAPSFTESPSSKTESPVSFTEGPKTTTTPVAENVTTTPSNGSAAEPERTTASFKDSDFSEFF